MALEIHDYSRDSQSLHDECKDHMYYHVILTMTDGSIVDGIIENVDVEHITMLVGEDVMEQEDKNQSIQQRQYNPYGRPRRRHRRFRRRRFPLADLAKLFIIPYPPYISPYPYYNPYPSPYYNQNLGQYYNPYYPY